VRDNLTLSITKLSGILTRNFINIDLYILDMHGYYLIPDEAKLVVCEISNIRDVPSDYYQVFNF